MAVTLSSNGTILVDGKPFHPAGFYYISFFPEENAQRLDDLRMLARIGCNCIATPLGSIDGKDFSASKAFLDEAQKRGVKVIVIPNDANGTLGGVNGLKGHPAILGWQTGDDVDNPANGRTPAGVKADADAVKRLDPNSLTYATGAGKLTPFVGTCDALGCEAYPVPTEPLAKVVRYLDPLVAVSPRNPVLANLQTIGPVQPFQLQCMVREALDAKAQGVLFYAFYESRLDKKDAGGRLIYDGALSRLTDVPYLWNEAAWQVSTLRQAYGG